jgi:hypothetical protein
MSRDDTERDDTERVASRVIEAIEGRDLAVIERAEVATWLGAVESAVVPFLRLRGAHRRRPRHGLQRELAVLAHS